MESSAGSKVSVCLEGDIWGPEELVWAVKGSCLSLGLPEFFKHCLIASFVSIPGGGKHHWEGK